MKFINYRKKNNIKLVLNHISPYHFYTGTKDEKFQQTGKKVSFECILKRHASSSSQFFRTTTVKQSGPENFQESVLTMIF